MRHIKKTTPKGIILLTITAFIWGSSFVAQSVGMESIDAFTFNGIRSILGALSLVPVILIFDITAKKKAGIKELEEKRKKDRNALKYGIPLALIFCIASNFQQFAFYYSTSGKIAFVTAIYMFFVPMISVFMKKRVALLTWICVFFGFVGLYMLCIGGNGFDGINKGDLLALGCAFFYAIQIIMIDSLAPKCDGLKLSATEFGIAGIISIILMFIFETPEISSIKTATVPLLYSGLMSCGVAYTLQILGQKHADATVASLLMCMESVFAAICGAIILHERMTAIEILGCAIMLLAIILSQVSEMMSAKKNDIKKELETSSF